MAGAGDGRAGSDEGGDGFPAGLGITALIAAIRAGPGDDQAQIPGHRQGKAGGIGGFTPEEGPQGLAGDGLVTLGLDCRDDGLQGHAFLGKEAAPELPAMRR